MIDLHSHILPGVDDGPPTRDESLRMALEARKLGISRVYATVHALGAGLIPDKGKLRELAAWLADESGLEVVPGYEVHFFALLEGADPEGLTLGQTRLLLFELPLTDMPPRVHEVVFSLVGRGLTPVLAHPERYLYLKIDRLREMKLWGLEFQGNLLSLAGAYGRTVRRRARAMLREGLFDIMASDAHRAEDYAMVGDLTEYLPEDLPWT